MGERLKGTVYAAYASGDDLRPIFEGLIFGSDPSGSGGDQGIRRVAATAEGQGKLVGCR